MRVLYGIGGEGSGHTMRSLGVIAYLRGRGHEVRVCTSNAAVRIVRKRKVPVDEVLHLPLVYARGKVMYARTAVRWLFTVLPWWWQAYRKVLRIIDSFRPDVIITDYEVFTSLAGKTRGLPVIAADNISMIVKTTIPRLPRCFERYRFWSALADTTATLHADWYVIPSFMPLKRRRSNVVVTEPPVREEIRSLTPTKGEHVLVYQTSRTNTRLLRVLKQTGYEYIVYGYQRTGRDGNLVFRRFNERRFLTEFASARAVILGGGFGMLTEALWLGKPIMSVPLQKHYEQCLNAHLVQRGGYGIACPRPTPEEIDAFLDGRYRRMPQWDPDAFSREVEGRALQYVV